MMLQASDIEYIPTRDKYTISILNGFWRWLRMTQVAKRQSPPPTFFLKTTLTQTITLNTLVTLAWVQAI